MVILHLLASTSYSGAENVACTIIDELNKNKEYKAIYVCPKGPIKKQLDNKKIKYILTDKMSLKSLNKICKEYNPDVIHAHDFSMTFLLSLLRTKAKKISHIHCNPMWLKNINLKSFVFLLSAKKMDKILLVSKSIEDEYIFKKNINKKTIVISNPIDVNKIKELSKKEEIEQNWDVMFLGRFSDEKNPKKFVNIINEYKQKYNKISAVMIGDGILKEECKDLIKKYELTENITIFDFQENPFVYLNKAKILCMTSKWEGYGLVAVEALSLGKPVVCKPVGGLKKIVNDNCGKFYNNIEECITEINRLLQDKKYYNQKSNSAIERSKELDNMKLYMNQIINIYKQD